jgi:hypothetical protein
MRSEPDPLDDAGEVPCGVAGAAVLGATDGLAALGVGDGGAGVGDVGAVAVAGSLALGEARVIAALASCTQAVTKHPATRIAAASSTLFR